MVRGYVSDDERFFSPIIVVAIRRRERIRLALIVEDHDSARLGFHELCEAFASGHGHRWADPEADPLVEALGDLLHRYQLLQGQVLEDNLDCSASSKVALVLIVVRRQLNCVNYL